MLPAFTKHICTICLAFLIISLSDLKAQETFNTDSIVTDPAHQFLWFHGHWNPSNKKQFIIDKDSTGGMTSSSGAGNGGTVTVEPGGSVQIKSPGIDEWNKKIDEDLKAIDDWENKLENPSAPDLTSYHLSQLLLPDVKNEKEEYSNYKIDPKTDILNPDKEKQAMNNLASNVAAYCQNFKPGYDAIIAFWKAHKNEKDADLSIPSPPEFEYDCYACDSNLRKVYDTTVAHYIRDFFHPEDSLVQQGLEVIRSFALMGIGPAGEGTSNKFNPILDLFHTDKKDPSKSGPCSYLDLYKLSDAVRDIAQHGYRRSVELVRRYHKTFKASAAVTKVFLKGAHDWMLFSGLNDIQIQNHLPELASMIGDNFNFYYDKLRQHDWKQLANIPFMIGLLNQKFLLSGKESKAELIDLFAKMSDILNNFRLKIDMDIKVGKEGGYELTHVKGETKIAIDFEQDSNQCYRWVAAEDQPKEIMEGLKIPVKKGSQKIDIDLLANQIIAPSPIVPVYAGTKKYYTLLKELKMDFCNPGNDTILLTSFIPSPEWSAGIWKIPHSPPAPMGINGLDHFFQDAEKMQELAESGQVQEGAEEMKKQAEELKAKMETLAGQMGNGTNKDKLNKYLELQKEITKSQDIGNSEKVSPILYIAFQLATQNNDVLMHKKYDAKEINPNEAGEIVYGYYTIDIAYKDKQ
ncbi:MAG: hypothetical protein ACHQF0_02525 [Chitinophagales bacterium]